MGGRGMCQTRVLQLAGLSVGAPGAQALAISPPSALRWGEGVAEGERGTGAGGRAVWGASLSPMLFKEARKWLQTWLRGSSLDLVVV